jgi:hypothetical protein
MQTYTWKDINPTVKNAIGSANHSTLGQIDIMKWYDDGTANVRYYNGRQGRLYRKRISISDLTQLRFA